MTKIGVRQALDTLFLASQKGLMTAQEHQELGMIYQGLKTWVDGKVKEELEKKETETEAEAEPEKLRSIIEQSLEEVKDAPNNSKPV